MMQNEDGTIWRTDEALFAAVPGGQALIDWFGFLPSFHDATLERLELNSGSATFVLRAFRMTDEVDRDGYFVCDKHALVTFELSSVTGVSLVGDATSIISGVGIRRLRAPVSFLTCAGPSEGDLQVAFESSYGLEGSIFARELRLSLAPTAG
jgi:hypothetical protein